MTRPAALRSTSTPFRRPNKRHTGGQKLGLDMERIPYSFNHREAAEDNVNELRNLRLSLIAAERDGRYSAAKKLRRQINASLEEGLYLTHSFCGGCLNVLHCCTC